MNASEPVFAEQSSRTSPGIVGVLIVSLVGINLASGAIVHTLQLPVFIDSIGIFVGAILLGPLVAAVIGAMTTIIGTLWNPPYWAFTGTAVVVGLSAGFLARAGMFRALWRALISGVVIGIVAGVVSAPVVVHVYGGATASGASLIIATLRQMGDSLWSAVMKAGVTADVIDKIIVAFLAWSVVRSLPNRVLALFPGARERIGAAPR